jgi:hypothetical protein
MYCQLPGCPSYQYQDRKPAVLFQVPTHPSLPM